MSQHAKPTPSLKQRLAKTLGGLTAISLTVTGLVALSVPAAQAVGCDPTATTIPTAPATAGFGGGTGQLATPWLICSRAQLAGIDDNTATSAGQFKLASNINLAGADWVPLNGTNFSGTLDGDYFSILNMSVRGQRDHYGFFARLAGGGTVKQIAFVDANILSESTRTIPIGSGTVPAAGVVAGATSSTTLTNILIQSATIGGNLFAAGFLVGENYSSGRGNLKVELVGLYGSTMSSTAPAAHASYQGGVVGIGFADVTRAKINSTITGRPEGSAYIGGIIGRSFDLTSDVTTRPKISQIQSEVSIVGGSPSATGRYGGFVGEGTAKITNSVFAGSFTNTGSHLGGAAGFLHLSMSESDWPGALPANNVILTRVPFSSSTHGPVLGGPADVSPPTQPITDFNSTATTFYNTTETTGYTPSQEYGVAKTATQLINLSTYDAGSGWSIAATDSAAVTTDWSLSDSTDPIWKIANGVSFPQLVWLDFFSLQFLRYDTNYTIWAGENVAARPSGDTTGFTFSLSGGGNIFSIRNASGSSSHGRIEASDNTVSGAQTNLTVTATNSAGSVSFPVTIKVSSGSYPSTQSAVDLSAGPEGGETVWASAFEKHLSTNLTTNNTALDEYAYRITTSENDEDTIVDTQLFGLSDYTALTAAEQQAWYDSMQAPYFFVWRAFVCVENSNGPIISQPSNMNVDYTSLQDIFIGTTIDQDDNADLRKVESTLNGSQPKTLTVVGETNINVRGTWESNKVVKGITSVSATCSAPATFEALDIVDENGLAINQKSLDTTSIYVDVQGTPVELDTEGLTIGVTGVVSNQFNEALWGITTIQASTSAGTQAGSTPYVGPTVTKIEGSTPGQLVTVRGNTLSTVSQVEIDGIAIEIKDASDSSFRFTLPATLKPGVKDLKITSSFGVLTVQAALTVLGSVETTLNTRGQWTKLQPSGTEVKLYAKEPVGRGKLQFFQNGREVAWIRAVDESDRKLSRASGAAYFVRTLALRPGKNRFEIRLDGLRVWRATYTPKS